MKERSSAVAMMVLHMSSHMVSAQREVSWRFFKNVAYDSIDLVNSQGSPSMSSFSQKHFSE